MIRKYVVWTIASCILFLSTCTNASVLFLPKRKEHAAPLIFGTQPLTVRELTSGQEEDFKIESFDCQAVSGAEWKEEKGGKCSSYYIENVWLLAYLFDSVTYYADSEENIRKMVGLQEAPCDKAIKTLFSIAGEPSARLKKPLTALASGERILIEMPLEETTLKENSLVLTAANDKCQLTYTFIRSRD